MVCNKISYAGQDILTIYHNDFNQIRKLKICRKIGRFNLMFEEYPCTIEKTNDIEGWYTHEEGLLSPKAKLNPYKDSACANMLHYCYKFKPSKLFKFCDGHYELKVSTKHFTEINEFVKEYTGFDLTDNPMFYGDIFFVGCNKLCYSAKEDKGIIISHLPAKSTSIVRFKNKGSIVSTKTITTDVEEHDIEIISDRPWISHDIEIYINNKLYYYNENISYIRYMQFSMNVKSSPKRVPLHNDDFYNIESRGTHEVINIGNTPSDIDQLLNTSTYNILNALKAETPNLQIDFIEPDQLNKVRDIICNVMLQAEDEIYIFDSYFSDKSHINDMLDWLRILANHNITHKNVIFYSKNPEAALSIPEIYTSITNDDELSKVLLYKNSLGINLLQTKTPIHDRFIIVKNKSNYSGIAIGTSLNSLNRNHYCIYKLNDNAAKTILEKLLNWLSVNNNLVDKGKV